MDIVAFYSVIVFFYLGVLVRGRVLDFGVSWFKCCVYYSSDIVINLIFEFYFSIWEME